MNIKYSFLLILITIFASSEITLTSAQVINNNNSDGDTITIILTDSSLGFNSIQSTDNNITFKVYQDSKNITLKQNNENGDVIVYDPSENDDIAIENNQGRSGFGKISYEANDVLEEKNAILYSMVVNNDKLEQNYNDYSNRKSSFSDHEKMDLEFIIDDRSGNHEIKSIYSNKTFILTFYNDYKFQFTNGKLILDDYDFKTSFFIVCDYIDKKKEIPCDNIKTLQQKDHDIHYSIRDWLFYKIHDYINKNVLRDHYDKGIWDKLFNQVVILIANQNEFTFKDSVGNKLTKINENPIINYHNINTEISVSTSPELLGEKKYTHDDGFAVFTFVGL